MLHGGSLLKPPFLLVLEPHSYERIEIGGLDFVKAAAIYNDGMMIAC